MKNRRRKIFLAAMLIGVMMLLAGAVSVSASVTMKTTKAAYLRTGPSNSTAKIVKVPKGVKVTAGVSDGKFTKVIYRGTKAYGGWFPSKYLKGNNSGSGSSSSKTKTTATAIWLRTGPGTNYSIIRAIEGGEKVTVLSLNGTWYRVQYQGVTGYLRQGYFTDETMIREVATAVYLRTGPTKSASAILVIPTLGKVTVLSRSGNWYRVNYNGRTGYIYSGAFTTDSGSSSSSSSTRIVNTTIYLRSSTDISSTRNVLAIIPGGSEVTVLSQPSSRWYIVRYNGRTGYLRSGYFA